MKYYHLLLLLLFFNQDGFSQQKIRQGNFKNLKGISSYTVTFDYSDLQVHGFDSEEAFLKEKMEKRAHKEGEAEKFRADWYADRSTKYEPQFIAYFNRRFDNGEISVTNNSQNQHTMHIKTTWIYPGYNVVAGNEPAKISAVITIFETGNPTNVLLEVEFTRSIGLEGSTFDFDQGYRIAGAYEKLAKNMVMQLKKNFIN